MDLRKRPVARSMAVALRLSAALALSATLGGCTSLLAGAKEPSTVYAPQAHVAAAPQWPTVKWGLAIVRAHGARSVDSLRIAVRPTPNELQVYKGAQWSRPPSEMLEESVLQALEDSGRIAEVARQGSGLGADYRLLLDVRRFESDYAGNAVPAATIEVTAKLLDVKTQQLAGSHTFLLQQPASSTAVPDVVSAFEQALTTISADLAGWSLTTGEAFERSKASQ